MSLPGLTHNHLGGDMLGRHTGMSSSIRPVFRTKELLLWMDDQIKRANEDREQILKQMKAEKEARKSMGMKKEKKMSKNSAGMQSSGVRMEKGRRESNARDARQQQ